MDARNREIHVQHVRAVCAERGIKIFANGVGFRLVGHGVDLAVADLGRVHDADLLPPRPSARERA